MGLLFFLFLRTRMMTIRIISKQTPPTDPTTASIIVIFELVETFKIVTIEEEVKKFVDWSTVVSSDVVC